MSSLKLNLIEGEIIVAMVEHEGHIYVKTSLGRYFRSTDAPVEHLDLIEVQG